MAGLAIATGLALLLLGGGAVSMLGSWSAFTPGYFGIALLLCGLIVLVRPSLRLKVTRAAMFIAAVGFVFPLIAITPVLIDAALGAGVNDPVAVSFSALMSAVCLVFLAVGAWMFIRTGRIA